MGTRPREGSQGVRPAADDSAALIGGLQQSLTRRSTRSQETWAELKRRYDPHLLTHARARIGASLARSIDPEDAVDEAWIRVFERWDDFEYKKKNSLRAWLCVQVDRVILDRCRRERRQPPAALGLSASSASPEPAADASGPATIVARNDRREQVVRAIDGLPEVYRRALKAVWLEEKPRDEVAKELNVKPNTLTVQLRRGMELLRARLDQDS